MIEFAMVLFITTGLIFAHQIASERKNLHIIAIGYIILIAVYLLLLNH